MKKIPLILTNSQCSLGRSIVNKLEPWHTFILMNSVQTEEDCEQVLELCRENFRTSQGGVLVNIVNPWQTELLTRCLELPLNIATITISLNSQYFAHHSVTDPRLQRLLAAQEDLDARSKSIHSPQQNQGLYAGKWLIHLRTNYLPDTEFDELPESQVDVNILADYLVQILGSYPRSLLQDLTVTLN